MHKIRIVVVDDHPLFREGVVHALNGSGEFGVVGEGSSAADAVRMASDLDPDVIVLDMQLPGGGLDAVEAIVATHSRAGILMLTVVDDNECVAKAFRIGARGYLLKGAGCNELMETVRSVARGDLYVSPQLVGKLLGRMTETQGDHDHTVEFTEREDQVLTLLSRGLSNKEIAYQLELSEKTIKYYLTNVLKKLRVRNRVEAALYASQRAAPPSQGLRHTAM